MHLIAIAPYHLFPATTGGRRAISLLYQHLAKEVPLTLLCTKDTKAPADYDVEIKKILSKSKFRYINPFLYFRVKKMMQEKDSRLLVIDHPYMAWVGVLLKWFTGIHFILRSHNIESIRFQSVGKWWWGLLWHYEKWMHRIADQSWFITEEDCQFAIEKYHVDSKKVTVVTFGTERFEAPSNEVKNAARKKIETAHNISNEKIFLFVGVLDYQPNVNAVENILRFVHRSLKASDQPYKILICGKGLPDTIKNIPEFKDDQIIYTGFVEDIESYFLGSDVFLNPVLEGGGIKSKLIEALGYGLPAVSTKSGANGVSLEATGAQLKVVADGNWEAFAKQVLETKDFIKFPNEFYKYYNWSNIANRAAKALKELV